MAIITLDNYGKVSMENFNNNLSMESTQNFREVAKDFYRENVPPDVLKKELDPDTPRDKWVYVCQYKTRGNNLFRKMLASVIRFATASEYTHSTWNTTCKKAQFFGLNLRATNPSGNMFTFENLLTGEGLGSASSIDSMGYAVYGYKVCDSEYERSVETIKKHMQSKTKFNAIKLLFLAGLPYLLTPKAAKDKNFHGFDPNQVKTLSLSACCSEYVAAALSQSIPRILKYYNDADINMNTITPGKLTSIPGMIKLFEGHTPRSYFSDLKECEKRLGVTLN